MTSEFVSVVGTINHDVIVTSAGRRFESLGGILYSAIPLAALLEGTPTSVRLHGRLADEDRAAAVRLLSEFPAADPCGLIADPGGTNRSFLDYSGPGDRSERVEMRVSPLSRDDLTGVAGARSVLVNMISGRDLSLEALVEARGESRGLLFLDVQALTRTLETPRRPRVVPGWERWCEVFDVVRGNEEEIAHFAGVPGDVRRAMRRILEAGAEEVLATRGERGSLRGVRGTGEIVWVEPFPCETPGDVTGCGDSFLAGACAGRILGLTAADAVRLGSWTAAQVCALTGLEALVALRGLRERAVRCFPQLSVNPDSV